MHFYSIGGNTELLAQPEHEIEGARELRRCRGLRIVKCSIHMLDGNGAKVKISIPGKQWVPVGIVACF